MLGTMLRRLVDDELVSLREIEMATGRGTSTIYRWMNGDSEPQYTDIRLLIRHLSDPEAQRAMVGLLTAELPVVVTWLDDSDLGVTPVPAGSERDVMDTTLRALACLTSVLQSEHDAIEQRELTREAYADLLRRLDETIRLLVQSRSGLSRHAPIERRKAKTSR